ncbi:unnamed protein product [Schistocephalus solidus]|uniref:Uncharacterized protein n=1 Tax=Schistocephalus solidus TaxID=70667 RepID=A0A183SCX7_SCHSO|nr:unnamed protein product [Schistocephalus solidus]
MRRPFTRPDPWFKSPPHQSSGVTKPLPPYRKHPSVYSPWDRDRVVTLALRRLNGIGALLSPLILGAALHSPPLLGEALHSLLNEVTVCNNVVVRPALRLPQMFM